MPLIREATLADVDALVAGNQAMALETESLVLDPAVLRRGVVAVLEASGKGRYFVAEADGDVAAQLMITYEWSDWRCGDVWWIQSVYVAPAHRRKGLYRALYQHVLVAAAAAGAPGIRLYVDQRNTPAQAVYTALGMCGDHYQVFEAMFAEPPIAEP